jgi:hypothetical protein
VESFVFLTPEGSDEGGFNLPNDSGSIPVSREYPVYLEQGRMFALKERRQRREGIVKDVFESGSPGMAPMLLNRPQSPKQPIR